MTPPRIDPRTLAFDIDGVVADTMTLFLDIARDELHLPEMRYEDITCYNLEECLDIDETALREIIAKLLDGTYQAPLRPIDGATEVLTRIGERHPPLRFVTARPAPELITGWMTDVLDVSSDAIEIVATGAFEAKTDVLREWGTVWFVEDRLETCHLLSEAGIRPIVFRQPWNRQAHPFHEVGTWAELAAWIED
jgi:uncharacterized protein